MSEQRLFKRLGGALTHAEREIEDTFAQARVKAEAIEREAHDKAQTILEDAEAEAARIRADAATWLVERLLGKPA